MEIVEWEETVLGLNAGHSSGDFCWWYIVVLCGEGWRRGSSQITSGFPVV